MDTLPNKERFCHHTQFTQSCRQLVVDGKCDRWMTFPGNDAITGQPTNVWKCSDDWQTILIYDTARQVNHLGAAMESFRNEVHNGNQVFGALLGHRDGTPLLRGKTDG